MTWRAPALAAFAALLLHAPAAGAATASVNSGTLSFIAGTGEKNDVSVSYDATIPGYRFADPGGGTLIGSSGCGGTEDAIVCEDKGVQVIVVNLRDGDDTWNGGTIPVVPTVDGGDGNDTLNGIGYLNGGAGDDVLMAPDSGSSLDGGDGNDRVVGGDGLDIMDGGAGDDLLIANDGDDFLTGGLGLDRLDTTGGGADTVDCAGRDDEIIQVGDDVKRQQCPGAAKLSVSVTKVRAKRLLSSGMPFSASCDRPCAITWELILDGKERKLVHHPGGWIDRLLAKKDREGFLNPVDGLQRFTARVVGNATKKGLKRLRSFSVTLRVRATSRAGLVATQTKKLKLG